VLHIQLLSVVAELGLLTQMVETAMFQVGIPMLLALEQKYNLLEAVAAEVIQVIPETQVTVAAVVVDLV
jgi:hypothetical protein